MEKRTLTATTEDAAQRLDVFLAARLEGVTRSSAQKLIERGAVRVNGKAAAKNHRLAAGETVEATLPDPEPTAAVPQAIALDVVYEDDDVIVVNKPKGMVVHPAAGHPDGTLVNALLHHCAGGLSGINGELRPGIVHRIDRDTSGLVIAAKTDAAHRALAAQLQDHTLARTYRCIVRGNLRQDSGTVNAPVGRDPKNRKRQAVTANGRPAVTHWRVLARFAGATYLECKLETGRTHQIRVHMAHIGHPILGDATYGGGSEKGLHGQCLHAVALRFRHPRTGEEREVTCPLPEEFMKELNKWEAKS
ncbi:MAG: RluA family pseudouridine synthase [Oscillibacter sp.]|nr:RluA family pseudouridine synthase [Oscillibacter sp.]